MSRVVVFGIGPMRWEQSTRLFALPLRTWHVASTLARDGHEVLLFSMRTSAFEGWPPEKVTLVERGGVRVYSVSEHLVYERPDWLEAKIRAFAPDCVIGVNKDPASAAVGFVGELPFWADVNGDPMAEAQSKAQATGTDLLTGEFYRRFLPVLMRADAFSTCSGAQRAALIGQLSMIGRLTAKNAGYELVHAIPNSIGDEDLRLLSAIERRPRRPDEPFVVLWSGGYNTWCDPALLFDVLERAMREEPLLRFVSTGGAIGGHYDDGYEAFRARVARSPHADRYHLAGWVQTAELPAYYGDAHAAILTDRFGYEGALGARTRMLDWLAAGLPIVCTRLSEISHELEREGAALCAECGDAEGLAAHVVRLARDPELAVSMGELGRRHVASRLRAGPTLRALRAWASAPARAPDGERRLALPSHEAPANELGSLARQLAARTKESGLRAGLADVRRFAARRARHGVQRVLDAAGLPGGVEVIELTSAGLAAEAPRLGAVQWQRRLAALGEAPRVAVVVFAEDEDEPEVLDWTLEQIARQYYDAWELVVAVPPVPALEARAREVAARFAAAERELAIVRRDHADPLAHAAVRRSAFAMVLGAGDLLRPDALAELVSAARQHEADLVYADEQDVDETNAPRPVRQLPRFSRELLLSLPFVTTAALVRTSRLELPSDRAARWPAAALGYDLALRATESTRAGRHLARVLCQRYRPIKRDPAARIRRERRVAELTMQALDDTIWRRGLRASVERGASAGTFRVRFELPEPSDVVLALPASGPHTARCVRALEERTDHPFDLVVALPAGAPAPSGDLFVARVPPGASTSSSIALALSEARAAFVGWVLPEVEALGPGWLEELVRQAARPGTGAAVPRLIAPDGSHAWPLSDHPAHAQETRELSAACALLPREVYESEGGLDPTLPHEAAVQALAARLEHRGLAIFYTPHASLYLHPGRAPEDGRRRRSA